MTESDIQAVRERSLSHLLLCRRCYGCKHHFNEQFYKACFPGGSAGKESARNAGDLGSIPGLGRSPGEGKGYPLQYSGLENPADCLVQGVSESRNDRETLTFHFHCEAFVGTL